MGGHAQLGQCVCTHMVPHMHVRCTQCVCIHMVLHIHTTCSLDQGLFLIHMLIDLLIYMFNVVLIFKRYKVITTMQEVGCVINIHICIEISFIYIHLKEEQYNRKYF